MNRSLSRCEWRRLAIHTHTVSRVKIAATSVRCCVTKKYKTWKTSREFVSWSWSPIRKNYLFNVTFLLFAQNALMLMLVVIMGVQVGSSRAESCCAASTWSIPNTFSAALALFPLIKRSWDLFTVAWASLSSLRDKNLSEFLSLIGLRRQSARFVSTFFFREAQSFFILPLLLIKSRSVGESRHENVSLVALWIIYIFLFNFNFFYFRWYSLTRPVAFIGCASVQCANCNRVWRVQKSCKSGLLISCVH